MDKNMRVRIAIFALLVAMNVCSFAAEIREGARMHLKENSMWFQSSSELATWQRFQQVSTPQVIKTYQDVVLGTREAWQFGNKLPVRIVTYWPNEHEVEVKMLPVGGRFDIWWVDAKDCIE